MCTAGLHRWGDALRLLCLLTMLLCRWETPTSSRHTLPHSTYSPPIVLQRAPQWWFYSQ